MNTKKVIIGLLSLATVLGMFFAPVLAHGVTISLTPTPTEPPQIDPIQLLRTIITWLFGFLIVVVVLMVMISAYLFVTAGGNPEQVGKARNWLVYALIGLAIGVLARGLVALVLQILGYTG